MNKSIDYYIYHVLKI